MKPEINLPRVYSGKISLGKTMFPWAKVRSVTSTIVYCRNRRGAAAAAEVVVAVVVVVVVL